MTTASRFRVSTVVASLATLSLLSAAVSGCAVRVEDAAPAPTASIAPQATRATPAPASTGAPTSGASGSASNGAAQAPVATVDDDSMARLQRAQQNGAAHRVGEANVRTRQLRRQQLQRRRKIVHRIVEDD